MFLNRSIGFCKTCCSLRQSRASVSQIIGLPNNNYKRLNRRRAVIFRSVANSPLKEFGKMLPKISHQRPQSMHNIIDKASEKIYSNDKEKISSKNAPDVTESKLNSSEDDPPADLAMNDSTMQDSNSQTTSPTDSYAPGQFFVHRVLGYIGVITASWSLDLYDVSKDEICKKNYYLVFPDEKTNRNCPFAFDSYVNEDDILPYRPTTLHAIKHINFEKFFRRGKNAEADNQFWEPKNNLYFLPRLYQNKLKFSGVYRQVTQDIQITVLPIYFEEPNSSHHSWYYQITMENLGKKSVRLERRTWTIKEGTIEGLEKVKTVFGHGVVERIPQLDQYTPGFEYNSFVNIEAKSGEMAGKYTFKQLDDGSYFDVTIPTFPLTIDGVPKFKRN